MSKSVTFFVPFGTFNISPSGKSLWVDFEDVENKGLSRSVTVPIKMVKYVERFDLDRALITIPYYFLKDKGLDSMTRLGQMKWRIRKV